MSRPLAPARVERALRRGSTDSRAAGTPGRTPCRCSRRRARRRIGQHQFREEGFDEEQQGRRSEERRGIEDRPHHLGTSEGFGLCVWSEGQASLPISVPGSDVVRLMLVSRLPRRKCWRDEQERVRPARSPPGRAPRSSYTPRIAIGLCHHHGENTRAHPRCGDCPGGSLGAGPNVLRRIGLGNGEQGVVWGLCQALQILLRPSWLATASILRREWKYCSVPQTMGLGSERRAHPNLNPPLLALLLAPMTMTGLAESYVCLVGLSLVLGLTGCGLVWNELRQAHLDNRHLPWLWIAFLVYFPTYTALKMGQVTFLLLLPVVGAWVAARRGRDTLAGILVGIAFSLKLFAGLILVYFALQRRWRTVAWSAGTVMLIAAITLPVVGLSAYVEYVGVVRGVTWFGSSWNASYAAFFTRVLGGSENVPLVDAPGVSRAIVTLLSALTMLWLAWLSSPARGGRRETCIFDLRIRTHVDHHAPGIAAGVDGPFSATRAARIPDLDSHERPGKHAASCGTCPRLGAEFVSHDSQAGQRGQLSGRVVHKR